MFQGVLLFQTAVPLRKIFHHLEPIMKVGESYIKNTGDLSEKLKNLGNIPSNTMLVTVDVVGLYPCVPTTLIIQALYEKLEENTENKIHLLT